MDFLANEAVRTVSLPMALGIYAGWGLFVFILKFILAQVRPTTQTEPVPLVDPNLSWWEGVLIFLLFVVAAICAVIGGFIAGIIGMICAIIATFWWLFGSPFVSGWLQFWREHPWWLWLVLIIACAPLVVVLLVLKLGFALTVGLILVVVALVALFLLFLIWGCVLLSWWERLIIAVWTWIEENLTVAIQWWEEQSVAIEQWEERKIEEYKTVRRSTCNTWHWALKWICMGWTYVEELVVEIVTILVKIIIWIVKLVLIIIYVVIAIFVLIVWFFTVFVLKTLLLCWWR